MDFELETRRIYLEDLQEKAELLKLLGHEGLELDNFIEYTVGIYHGQTLIATGSFYKNTLRCLAVRREH